MIDGVRLRFSLPSDITCCNERVVEIRRQRQPSTSGASPPKASQLSMLFHKISLSPQHLDLRSVKQRDPRELEAMEREML